MTSRPTKDELLQPVNGYQLQAVSDKLDAQARSLEEVKALILAQSQTYPTKTELDLQLEKRDNRIKSLEKTLGNYSKVVWTLVSAFIPMLALSIWQLMLNGARGGGQ